MNLLHFQTIWFRICVLPWRHSLRILLSVKMQSNHTVSLWILFHASLELKKKALNAQKLGLLMDGVIKFYQTNMFISWMIQSLFFFQGKCPDQGWGFAQISSIDVLVISDYIPFFLPLDYRSNRVNWVPCHSLNGSMER